MNFPGATAFLLLFPFPTGVCFYCMPRCLSFQKTNGHDEQQKQRPEALGRGVAEAAGGWQAEMPPKWIFVIIIVAGLVC